MEIQKHLPLIAMIANQFIYAGLFLFSKAAISSGMKPSVFVAYRQAAATIALAPLAFFYERKKSPPLTWYIIFKVFIVSSCGISMSLNLHYIGLRYVSATFATAITNTIPAMVFIIAISLRIEKLDIAKRQGLAKVIGSILGLTGAMVYTFYKGPPINSSPKYEASNSSEMNHTKEEWIKGSILMLFSNLTWAMWLILQTPLLKQYPAKLRLTTMQIGFSCLTTTIYGATIERDISSWKLGWNVNLLSVAYCCLAFILYVPYFILLIILGYIVVTGITYTIQVWVVEKRGPVFTSIFSPLALILTAIFSAIIFHETLHLGSVLGGLLLVGGLYAFLWGKNKEVQINGSAQQQLDSIVTSKSPIDEQTKENESHNIKPPN